MLQENEVLMFLIGLGVLVFILSNRSRLKAIPASKILFAGFLVLFTGWIVTNAEHLLLPNILNYTEHICYAVSSVLVAAWCWKVFSRKGEAE